MSGRTNDELIVDLGKLIAADLFTDCDDTKGDQMLVKLGDVTLMMWSEEMVADYIAVFLKAEGVTI